MIWQIWWNLTKIRRKKQHVRKALHTTEGKIWENEFLKHQLWEVRGNMREQYDWLRERVEGAIRRLAEIKYEIFYAETNDLVKVMDLPLPPREVENLPGKPTPPHRFYKKDKPERDEKIMKELERLIENRQPDLDQQKEQLKGVDAKMAEIDGSIAGLHELKSSLLARLKQI